MPLIDQYLPAFQFREIHTREIAATPQAIMQAVQDYRPETDPFFRSMIGLREIPMRLVARLRGGKGPLAPPPPPFSLANFTLLEQDGEQELVYGLIGKFWQLDYGQVRFADAAAFRRFDQPGVARLALCFRLEPLSTGAVRLSTETRVHCPDQATRRQFAPYWYLIRPVSALIRQRILAAIARQAGSTR